MAENIFIKYPLVYSFSNSKILTRRSAALQIRMGTGRIYQKTVNVIIRNSQWCVLHFCRL